jgi:4'-phosphopantetheinyl transferase
MTLPTQCGQQSSTIQWKPAPENPGLRPGEVHVWRVSLQDANPEELGPLLSPAEWMRARRFHFERDQQRFICGRGLLRRILAQYLETDPHELRFTEGPHGKPELTGTCSALRFNLSHSDDLMLLAVTHTRAIGIDLELMRDNVPVETLADYYFEPEDAWRLRLLPPAQRVWKFYEIWTSAEARLKADGAGISRGLKVIEPDRWSLLKLTPAEGYAAALAVEGEGFQVECWSWQK